MEAMLERNHQCLSSTLDVFYLYIKMFLHIFLRRIFFPFYLRSCIFFAEVLPDYSLSLLYHFYIFMSQYVLFGLISFWYRRNIQFHKSTQLLVTAPIVHCRRHEFSYFNSKENVMPIDTPKKTFGNYSLPYSRNCLVYIQTLDHTQIRIFASKSRHTQRHETAGMLTCLSNEHTHIWEYMYTYISLFTST